MEGKEPGNPYDINGPNFSPEMYIQSIFKESSLKQIMEKESEIIKDTQTLHSDMQTLVYENYNKFIAATDTIRKMKSDFKEMEAEMDLLAAKMESIASFSEQISMTLQDTRSKLTNLSSVHSLLKKLQFLFRLPFTLNKNLEDGSLAEAVKNYTHAQKTLVLYQETPSFQGIQSDSQAIIEQIKHCLFDRFRNKMASTKELGEALELLLQLGEHPSKLCRQFLSHTSDRQRDQLSILECHVEQQDQDVIEFIDLASREFLSDLCLMVATYNDMFINKSFLDIGYTEEDAVELLNAFVSGAMKQYLDIVKKRMHLEQQSGTEAAILVRALDRFYRRLQAVSTLLPCQDFARSGLEVVLNSSQKQAESQLESLKAHFIELLSQARQTLAAARLSVPHDEPDQAAAPAKAASRASLSDLLTTLVAASVERVKCSLHELMLFLQTDLTFNLKPQFKSTFCHKFVREGLVVAFIKFITETAAGFCVGPERTPPTLLLLLSKMCLELEVSSVHYLISQTDEMFQIDDRVQLTSKSELCKDLHTAGQNLLDHYVRMQGLSISQMLRKSVETRDWLHTVEPRTVRAVMKRVVEDVASIDTQVNALYEEGARQERSSDSSRRTHRHQYRSNWSSYAPSQLDSSLVTNIQKLFSERIEIFSSVEFSKVSILTGIVKISLKTLLECIRLRTFSRFGLQQIQVDTHYLQLYLWRFVCDENLVHFLLDEILGSAVHRCLEPVLMEPSVVDMICERG